MSIATTCPACHHAYRLKDELAGKRVKCKNPVCQETFTVPRPANAPPATVPPVVDADTLAAQALADEPEAVTSTDARAIAMTCVICEHKWSEPWDKQGKNVLCPECRHRQKVPVPQATKPADWRGGRGGPSLARQPELEGVNASGNAGYVSGEALRSVGLGRPELEPRPLWQKVAFVAGPIAVILFGVLGVRFYLGSRSGASEAALMATALAEMPEPSGSAMPKVEVPPARAALLIAGGKYNARRAADGEVPATEAVKLLARARQELADAPASPARDFLWGELVDAELALGGDTEAVNAERKLRWTPQLAGVARARVSEKVYSVQDELRQTFEAMKFADRPAPLEVRLAAFRAAARALNAAGLPDAAGQLIPTLFTDDGATEAAAENVAERYRASGDPAPLTALVTGAVPTLKDKPAGPTLLAIAQLVPNPPAELALSPLTPGDDRARLAHGALALLKKNPSEAIEIAKRPGKLAPRLTLLCLVAEWSDDPGAAVAAAADVLKVEATNKDVGVAPDWALVRLAGYAGKPDLADAAKTIAAATRDDAKSLALSVSAAATWRGAKSPLPVSAWEVPADPAAIRFGQLWGRMALARANAAAGESKPASAFSGAERPFALAGAALGRQDRDSK